MATNTEQREADYTCPVCCDIFTDPVLLLCGHSFCQHCLQEWWRQSKLRTCPVCKETFPMTRPPRNLALRNLSDSLRQERSRSAGSKELCSLHGEKWDTIAHQIQIQAQQTEKTIRAEFQKLYQFLRAEEAGRIDACRKEAKLKSGPVNLQLVNLTAEISELVKKTKTIEDEMRKDDLSFMLNARTTLQGFLSKQQETETPTGTLMDEAKHISNLQFSVWKKMTDTVQYTPVTLDRNTSCRSLAILDNLTKSRVFYLQAFDFPSISDTPERLGDSDILGYQGLNSGKHSWDVEVDGYWAVGVATKTKELRDKKTWAIHMSSTLGTVCNLTLGDHSTVIAVDYFPEKVRVQFDYDKGISFFDLDQKKIVYVIKYNFTETVFPYFRHNVRILPTKLSVSINHPRFTI